MRHSAWRSLVSNAQSPFAHSLRFSARDGIQQAGRLTIALVVIQRRLAEQPSSIQRRLSEDAAQRYQRSFYATGCAYGRGPSECPFVQRKAGGLGLLRWLLRVVVETCGVSTDLQGNGDAVAMTCGG